MRFTVILMKFTLAVLILSNFNIYAQEPVQTPLRALLVTGQSNHNWQVAAPVLKTILEDDGLFLVDVATTPLAGDDMSGFMPQFAAYSVIVLNYTGDAWSESTQEEFVAYVANGGGVVVVHESNNAFPEWPAYNEIIGLGGWGNRDERHGPYVYWQDGRVIYDTTAGGGGGHGRAHTFEITHRQPDHPITRGLPVTWLHSTDELYHRLRGPARNMTVLGTAWSDLETGGTGRDEPILFSVAYGKGRMFQTTLGHAGASSAASPCLQCTGFIVTLRRGAEWAATGNVTQAIPEDFPEKDVERIRPRFVKNSVAVLMKELAVYKYNDPRETLVLLEELTRRRQGAGDSVDDLELAYLELLQSEDATQEAKSFACKQLSMVGGRKSIPILSEILLDFDLADMARYALQRIPHSNAKIALGDALSLVGPEHRAGIIASLGVLQDLRAIKAISAHIHDSDERVVTAALHALAAMPSAEAAAVLLVAVEQKEGDLKRLAKVSYVKCGFSLLERRRTVDAKKVFTTAIETMTEDLNLRVTALRGIIAAAGRNKEGDVIINVLQSDDLAMHPIAAAAVRNISNRTVLRTLVTLLPELDDYTKIVLLTALSETLVDCVTPQLVEMVKSEDEPVRLAVLKALAVVGDKEAALFLVQHAVSTSGTEQKLTRLALSRLKGANPVIVKAFKEEDTALRSEFLKAISARHISEVAPFLIDMLAASSDDERLEILDVLMQIAEPKHLDSIIPLLLSATEEKEGAAMATLVATVAQKENRGEERVAALVVALQSDITTAARCNVYVALGEIEDESSLALLEAGLEEQDTAVHFTVVKALANWPTIASLNTVQSIMKSEQGTQEGSLALNGYIRLVGLNTKLGVEEAVSLYEAALSFAVTSEEKQACMTAIGNTVTDAALPILYEALVCTDIEVARIAVRSLSSWPDAVPMTRLEILAKDGPDALKSDALCGYFRLIGINHEITEGEAVERYREALALASSDTERKRIMAGLATAETLGALRVVLEYIDTAELRNEAEVAAVKIAAKVAGSSPMEVSEALEKLAKATENDFVRTEIEKVRVQMARFEDYITAWNVAGPFTLENSGLRELFNTSFPPESNDDEGVHWRIIPAGTDEDMPYLVELDKALDGDMCVAYLQTNVWTGEACDALLEIGSDDGNKVWLNGELVNEANTARMVAPAQDRVEIKLKEGWNPLLVKITQAGGEWSTCVRICTPDGSPLDGLRVSVHPE